VNPNDEQMKWQLLVARSQARGAGGELLPLVTGRETEAELRLLSLQLAGNCPCGKSHPHCPFRLMSKHSPGSVKHLLETMPEAELRELFVTELLCRTIAQRNERQDLKTM